MIGGAIPHRISLSDTILIFKEHVVFVGFEEVLKSFVVFKKKSGGKNIGIEVSSKEEDVKEIIEHRNSFKSLSLISIAGV